MLRAYRALAAAIGPVPARRLLPVLRTSPLAEAAGQVDELHASLARERARVVEALRGLAVVVGEPDLPAVEGDAMTIGELAQALDVRPSALRHWERAGLLAPRRAAAARDTAMDRNFRLDMLPNDLAGKVRELSAYDFESAEAAQRFEQRWTSSASSSPSRWSTR